MILAQRACCRIFVMFLAYASTSCTTRFGHYAPNSHFAYPNSNVMPLGHVSGEVSATRVLFPKVVDRDMLDEVIMKALQKKEGYMLVNYKTTTETTQWIPFLYTTTLRVSGTAVNMTVGSQDVSHREGK